MVSLPPPAPSCPTAGLTALEGGVPDLGSSGLSVGISVRYPVLGGEALPPQEGSENGGPGCTPHRGASRPPCAGSVSPTPPSSLPLLLAGGQAARRGVSESLAQPLIPEAERLDLGGGAVGLAGDRGAAACPPAQLPFTPTLSPHRCPWALPVPRLTSFQRRHTAPGQGESTRLPGHPNPFQS